MAKRTPLESAALATARLARKYPLLAAAGELPTITPEQITAARAAYFARLEKAMRDAERIGQQHRRRVAARVTPERLAELDRARAKLPASGEYTADFWSAVSTEANPPTPVQLPCGCVAPLTMGARLTHERLGNCRYCKKPVYRCEATDTPPGVTWREGLVAHLGCAEDADARWKQMQKNPLPIAKKSITDRAQRYRAQRAVGARDRCMYCGRPRPRDVDHINGREEDNAPENLAPACHRCNTHKGLVFARTGIGRRTRQFNPQAKTAGARNLAQWTQAVMSIHGGGPWPIREAVEMIRATPRSDRRAYAAEIWRRRRAHGTAGRPRPGRPSPDDIPF
jgi:hypothetical protein